MPNGVKRPNLRSCCNNGCIFIEGPASSAISSTRQRPLCKDVSDHSFSPELWLSKKNRIGHVTAPANLA
jgi:hypothetical protein